jgi:hypothetical protein
VLHEQVDAFLHAYVVVPAVGNVGNSSNAFLGGLAGSQITLPCFAEVLACVDFENQTAELTPFDWMPYWRSLLASPLSFSGNPLISFQGDSGKA